MALKNLTITVEEEVARWARLKAAEENTSVSKLVGRMLEREMTVGGDSRRRYEEWKHLRPIPGASKGRKFSREEMHARP